LERRAGPGRDKIVGNREAMTRTILLVLVAFASAQTVFADDVQFKALAASFRSNLPDASQRTVAVTDFTDLQGNVTELGRYLAEELSVALAIEGLQVIDRTHLKALLQENKLAATGIIDPATARKLGEIAGVDTLVTGSLTPLGDSVRLSAKALDTKTARIRWATGVDVPKTKAIEALLERSIGPSGGTTPSAQRFESNAPTAASLLKTVAEQFSFEVKRCAFRGADVICAMSLTNLSEDASVTLFSRDSYGTRMFDNLGNECRSAQLWLGTASSDYSVQLQLISGVPTNAAIRFENVSSSADRITVLDIGVNGRNKWFHAQIRNIPISR
jgi:TolB-like protein